MSKPEFQIGYRSRAHPYTASVAFLSKAYVSLSSHSVAPTSPSWCHAIPVSWGAHTFSSRTPSLSCDSPPCRMSSVHRIKLSRDLHMVSPLLNCHTDCATRQAWPVRTLAHLCLLTWEVAANGMIFFHLCGYSGVGIQWQRCDQVVAEAQRAG